MRDDEVDAAAKLDAEIEALLGRLEHYIGQYAVRGKQATRARADMALLAALFEAIPPAVRLPWLDVFRAATG